MSTARCVSAIDGVLAMAIATACTCGQTAEFEVLCHEKHCPVYLNRKDLLLLFDLIEKAEKK
jgi:hypothetical protein